MRQQLLALLLFAFGSVAIAADDEKSLPEFELVQMKSGQRVTYQDFAGKVIYLDFWASWCIPCRKSFPFMNQLKSELPEEKFAVIAVNLDEELDEAKRFLERYPAEFSIYLDPDASLASRIEVPGLPVAYIIDGEGKIRATHLGFKDKNKTKKRQQLEHLINAL